ncbi:uncharacterized protein KGF55_004744 [Candida pseudojiufengensis]|uniref:uncharacterized protein n=1 Tax=Candida pseudojiufengensis TaxID=497109 RepID=UPI0022244244|nr:uncharacterized protein KGF55_004744 [Candida pseudojiufengensis]KAI5960451.1 hypothetical protein KGF55_004744 [Candida pseudojiufengensis]
MSTLLAARRLYDVAMNKVSVKRVFVLNTNIHATSLIISSQRRHLNAQSNQLQSSATTQINSNSGYKFHAPTRRHGTSPALKQDLIGINSKKELEKYFIKYKNKNNDVSSLPPSMQLLQNARRNNFNISGNIWINHQRMCKSNVHEIQLVDWVGLFAFRFNNQILDVLQFNNHWKRIAKYDSSLFPIYYSSFICWLINTDQTYLAAKHVIQYLMTEHNDPNLIPIGTMISKLVDNEDLSMIRKILKLSLKRDYRLSHEVWSKILNLGLKNNDYAIVKQAYTQYVMEGFTDGKISIEESILSPSLVSKNHVFQSMSDSLLMQILQIFSMNGDTKSTIDLIESHFFHKVVAGKSALNKSLCLKIIESHCYDDDEEGISSMEFILELINTFVKRTKHNPNDALNAKDLFRAMNRKIGHLDLGIVKRKEPEVNRPMNDQIPVITPGHSDNETYLVLANTTTLHDFIVRNIRFIDQHNFDAKSKSIFIDCLLNYISTYLNHTGVVKVLESLHYLDPQNLEYLNSNSFDLILQSLSNSSSKKCAIYYHKYMKANGMEFSPDKYIWLIQSCFNEFYEPTVTYLIYHYFKDHVVGHFAESQISTLIDIIPDDVEGQVLKLKNFLMQKSTKSVVAIDDCYKYLGSTINENEVVLFSAFGPKHKRRYFREYDEIDLSILKKVLPILEDTATVK